MEVSNTAAISLQTNLSMSNILSFLTKKKHLTSHYPNGRIRYIIKIPQEMCFVFLSVLEKVCLVTIALAWMCQT